MVCVAYFKQITIVSFLVSDSIPFTSVELLQIEPANKSVEGAEERVQVIGKKQGAKGPVSVFRISFPHSHSIASFTQPTIPFPFSCSCIPIPHVYAFSYSNSIPHALSRPFSHSHSHALSLPFSHSHSPCSSTWSQIWWLCSESMLQTQRNSAPSLERFSYTPLLIGYDVIMTSLLICY